MLIRVSEDEQVLKIGDDIDISLLLVNGSQVRIGINAPKNIIVHRREIYEQKAEESRLSSE